MTELLSLPHTNRPRPTLTSLRKRPSSSSCTGCRASPATTQRSVHYKPTFATRLTSQICCWGSTTRRGPRFGHSHAGASHHLPLLYGLVLAPGSLGPWFPSLCHLCSGLRLPSSPSSTPAVPLCPFPSCPGGRLGLVWRNSHGRHRLISGPPPAVDALRARRPRPRRRCLFWQSLVPLRTVPLCTTPLLCHCAQNLPCATVHKPPPMPWPCRRCS